MCRVASEMCSNSYVYDDHGANVYILIYICTIFISFSIYIHNHTYTYLILIYCISTQNAAITSHHGISPASGSSVSPWRSPKRRRERSKQRISKSAPQPKLSRRDRQASFGRWNVCLCHGLDRFKGKNCSYIGWISWICWIGKPWETLNITQFLLGTTMVSCRFSLTSKKI